MSAKIMDANKRSEWPWATWVLVASPILSLLLFLTLAIHVRVGLGHWPKPMYEQYSTTAYIAHNWAVYTMGISALYFAIPAWLVSLCFRCFRMSWRIHLYQAALYLSGWGLIVLYSLWDPWRFFSWWAD